MKLTGKVTLVSVILLLTSNTFGYVTVKGIANIQKYGPFICVDEVLAIGGLDELELFPNVTLGQNQRAFYDITIASPFTNFETDYTSYFRLSADETIPASALDNQQVDVFFYTDIDMSTLVPGGPTSFDFIERGPLGEISGTVVFVPEPSISLLFGLGAVMLRVNRKGNLTKS